MKELRRAGFQVRAVWAAGRKSAERIKRELNIECCTTDIKELVIRADVDLGKYFISQRSVDHGPLAGIYKSIGFSKIPGKIIQKIFSNTIK